MDVGLEVTAETGLLEEESQQKKMAFGTESSNKRICIMYEFCSKDQKRIVTVTGARQSRPRSRQEAAQHD